MTFAAPSTTVISMTRPKESHGAMPVSFLSLVRVVAASMIDLKTPELSRTPHSAAIATSSTMNMHSEKVSDTRSTDSGPRCDTFNRARLAAEDDLLTGATVGGP